MWPADPPGRYAVFEGGVLSVVDGTERHEFPGVSEDPVAGGFVGDVLVFSVGCCDGIWAWDYAESDATDRLIGGGDGEHVTFHGVASDWDQPGFFYTIGGDQPSDTPDLMFYDVGTARSHRFVQMNQRRPGLTEEEQNASVGPVVATGDLAGLLITFGDGTWVEWYTDTGQPAEAPFEGVDEGDTVLELALAPDGDLLAVGREERLHQGITTVEVVASDGDTRSYSVPDQQSLRHLQFDGQYVTASVHRTDPAGGADEGDPGRLVLDIEQNHFGYSIGPRVLALGRSEPTDQGASSADPSAVPDDSSVSQAESLVESFIVFSENPTADTFTDLPLAETVELGLGPSILGTVEGDQLRHPGMWRLDVEMFRAYLGPFSALETLRELGSYEVTVGDHPHCASPPVPPPDGFETHQRVSVQPQHGPQVSCLEWVTVDFFLEPGGEVEAITLDMYEP